MKFTQLTASLAIFTCAAFSTASAHITYSNRNWGTLTGGSTYQTGTNTNPQAVTGNYGWADGTLSANADSHKGRWYRFTLLNAATVTIEFTGTSYTVGQTTFDAMVHPAFSVYSGLATSPVAPHTGAFKSLADFSLLNDDSVASNFTYVGHAADGGSANYGSASGVNGDGVADGFVSGTFVLPAGDYSVMVGGGDYAVAGRVETSYGVDGSITVIPEPSVFALVALSAIIFAFWRRSRGLLAPIV